MEINKYTEGLWRDFFLQRLNKIESLKPGSQY